MLNEQDHTTGVETIDLRVFVATILKRWKLLLILMIIGGIITGAYHFFRTPVYTATSVVSIDPTLLIGGTTPIFALQGDEIKGAVAEKYNISIADLPVVSVTSDKTDKSISKISLESTDPKLAVEMVNAWADSGVNWIIHNLEQMDVDLKNAITQVTEKNAKLNNYLQANNLNDLTWYDLVALTGIGSSDNLTIGDNTRVLPDISSKQRLELGELMRQKGIAEWDYNRISRDILENNYRITDRVNVLNKAYEAVDESILGSVLIIPLGVFAGLVFALLWILIEDWWKHSTIPVQEKKQ